MSSGGTSHSSGARLSSDAITSHGLRFRSWDALRDGRCPVRALKGMSGAPTSCSTRSSVTEHGRAYKTRVSWSRSSRSTQSDCCNGRTQTDRNVCRWLVDHRTSDQVRGRAGEGEQVTRWSGPARYARCGTPKQDGSSAEVHSGWSLESGLRSKDSRARLEGGRWKRAARYLAGGLPYFTSSSEARRREQSRLLSRQYPRGGAWLRNAMVKKLKRE